MLDVRLAYNLPRLCEVLGWSLNAARLPIDNFFNYIGQKSPFTGLSLRVRNISFMERSPKRKGMKRLTWNWNTTNKIRSSLADPACFWTYGSIWVGSSLWSLQLCQNTTRARQSTQLLLTQSPGSDSQLQSDHIKIIVWDLWQTQVEFTGVAVCGAPITSVWKDLGTSSRSILERHHTWSSYLNQIRNWKRHFMSVVRHLWAYCTDFDSFLEILP